MNFAPEFAHHSARDLWVPMIDARKKTKDGPRRYNVVEMSDHVVRIVQMKIAVVESERQAG